MAVWGASTRSPSPAGSRKTVGRATSPAATCTATGPASRGSLRRGRAELHSRLEGLPAEHREVLVAVCARGDVPTLARGPGSDERSAAARRASTLAFMHDVAAPGLPDAPDPEGKD